MYLYHWLCWVDYPDPEAVDRYQLFWVLYWWCVVLSFELIFPLRVEDAPFLWVGLDQSFGWLYSMGLMPLFAILVQDEVAVLLVREP